MVYCRIHQVYLNGRKAKAYHIKKYNCSFLLNYKKPEQPKKYNKRNPDNKNKELMGKYLWKRESNRSRYRTDIKKGKRKK
jgi:hypothetical protein